MMRRSLIAAAAFCAALVLPALATAQTVAYAVYDGYTNVRAGPSTRYQIIAQLAPGTEVDVLGCLETRAWCQILVEDLEGWVYSRRLEFFYSGNRYLVPDYYSYFNAPFVFFNFGSYDHNYGHRRYRRYDDPIFHPRGGVASPGGDGPVMGDPGGPRSGGLPEPVIRQDGVIGGGFSPDTGVSSGGGGGGFCPPGDPSCPNTD